MLIASAAREVPLCVDLDGTLLRTDLLFESLLSMVRRRWWAALLVPFWLMRGRAYMKERIAAHAELDPALLPYRSDLLAWLRQQKRLGRRIILATGAQEKLAGAVADHLELFDGVIASDSTTNLTGENKARRLTREFGETGFDYAGDSRADRPVWLRAQRRIAAGSEARGSGRFELVFREQGSTLRALIRALRPKHWVKNTLVFVPLLAGHRMLDVPLVLRALAAFAAFSLTASAVYVINDLLDLSSDRCHPIKKRRPFAAGDLSLQTGLLMAPVLLAGGLTIAAALGLQAFGMLLTYLALTFAYTFYLKRKLLTDVFALAILYTLRMLEGSVATGVLCSMWLVAFAMFQFLSLAFLKRSAELSRLAQSRHAEATGRGYFSWDLVQVNVFGVTAAYISSLVLGLYMTGHSVGLLYKQPAWLWTLVPAHLYWMSRAWILSHRGAMNEDPILFAFSDRVTWLCGLGAAVALMLATHGGVPIPGVSQ